jgi:hypothetical protein
MNRDFVEMFCEIEIGCQITRVSLLNLFLSLWRPVFMKCLAIEVSYLGTLIRIGHDHEMVPLTIAASRCLDGDFKAFLDNLRLNWACQVEASTYGAGRGE